MEGKTPYIQDNKCAFNGQLFAERLREKRNNKFKSREAMAKAVQDKFPYEMVKTFAERIKDYESGETNNPKIDNVLKMANVLECDPGYLFGFYDETTKELHDISDATGLSELAIVQLKDIKNRNPIMHGKELKYPSVCELISLFFETSFGELMFYMIQRLVLSCWVAKNGMNLPNPEIKEIERFYSDIEEERYQIKVYLESFLNELCDYKSILCEIESFIDSKEYKDVEEEVCNHHIGKSLMSPHR